VSVVSQVARATGAEVRPPGSEAERAAAGRLAAWLRARGDAAEVRPRRTRPQALAATGAGAAIAVAGSLLSVVSAPAAIACAVLGLLVIALEAAGLASPVRLLFPTREIADVYVPPRAGGEDAGGAARETARRAVVVCAGFGSPRLGLAFGSRLRRRSVRWWLPAAAVLVFAACVARASGAGGLWLGLGQLIPTVALLVALAAAIDAGLAGWGPGEAAAAAVAVAVHDELAARPPRTLVPALLLHGAARPRLEAAVVLEIRPGAGVRAGDARLAAATDRATAALGLSPRALPRPAREHIALGAASVRSESAGASGDARPGAGGVATGDLEAAVDLALAIVDAVDQAQPSSPAATASTP
jgi:hypothetical protein